jgi:energy-coupling factor transporter ATP-binding protein EcfA2
MKGIEKITIQNFKAFREAETFSPKGKHLLVYGPNGSGKSSLYFSLYTLLQSESKPLPKIKKYFDRTDKENLLNVHEPWNKSSFIKLILTDKKRKPYTLSKTGLSPTAARDRKVLGEMNLASEFVSHRLLINFYNFRNSKEIDLYPVFDRDIFPFIFLDGKKVLFSDKIKEVEAKGAAVVGTPTSNKFKNWVSQISELDNELNKLISYIDRTATNFLHLNFGKDDLKIVLKLNKGFSYRRTGKTNNYELLSPFIKLSIEKKLSNGKFKAIDRPQSFLNEGKLTAIALSIRFTLLDRRPTKPDLKILAFDDLLISLDMENRMDVLRLIFKLYEKDYQLFFFTHDWGFYEEVKRFTEADTQKWTYLEFNEILENKKPSYKDGKTLMQQAKRYLEDHDYNACALALRKIGETVVENFLEKKMNMVFDKKDFVTFGQKLNEAKNAIDKANYTRFQEMILENDFTDPVLSKISEQDFTAVMRDTNIDGKKKAKLIAIRRDLFKMVFSLNKDNMAALKV